MYAVSATRLLSITNKRGKQCGIMGADQYISTVCGQAEMFIDMFDSFILTVTATGSQMSCNVTFN